MDGPTPSRRSSNIMGKNKVRTCGISRQFSETTQRYGHATVSASWAQVVDDWMPLPIAPLMKNHGFSNFKIPACRYIERNQALGGGEQEILMNLTDRNQKERVSADHPI